jgi:hypothetical protein
MISFILERLHLLYLITAIILAIFIYHKIFLIIPLDGGWGISESNSCSGCGLLLGYHRWLFIEHALGDHTLQVFIFLA